MVLQIICLPETNFYFIGMDVRLKNCRFISLRGDVFIACIMIVIERLCLFEKSWQCVLFFDLYKEDFLLGFCRFNEIGFRKAENKWLMY